MSDERTIEDRMTVALILAQQRSRCGRSDETISIHVGAEGWGWLRSLADSVGVSLKPQRERWRLCGFPVLLEAAWPSDKIAIRTEQVIY